MWEGFPWSLSHRLHQASFYRLISGCVSSRDDLWLLRLWASNSFFICPSVAAQSPITWTRVANTMSSPHGP